MYICCIKGKNPTKEKVLDYCIKQDNHNGCINLTLIIGRRQKDGKKKRQAKKNGKQRLVFCQKQNKNYAVRARN